MVELRVDLFQHRDAVCRGFAGAVLGAGQDVTPCQADGDGLLLRVTVTNASVLDWTALQDAG